MSNIFNEFDSNSVFVEYYKPKLALPKHISVATPK